MLRHVSADEFTIWLVTSSPCQPVLALYLVAEQDYTSVSLCQDDNSEHIYYQVGTHAFIHLLHIHQTDLLAPDTQYAYDVELIRHTTEPSSDATQEPERSICNK